MEKSTFFHGGGAQQNCTENGRSFATSLRRHCFLGSQSEQKWRPKAAFFASFFYNTLWIAPNYEHPIKESQVHSVIRLDMSVPILLHKGPMINVGRGGADKPEGTKSDLGDEGSALFSNQKVISSMKLPGKKVKLKVFASVTKELLVKEF